MYATPASLPAAISAERLDKLADVAWSEHAARRDAEEQGVADLAGGAGDCDTNGRRHAAERRWRPPFAGNERQLIAIVCMINCV